MYFLVFACVGDRDEGLPLCVLRTFAFLLSTCDYSLQLYHSNTRGNALVSGFL